MFRPARALNSAMMAAGSEVSRVSKHLGSGDLIEDMYGFARCDYLIGPLSTFTMWASFYGGVPLNTIRFADQLLKLADFAIQDRLIEDWAAKALEDSERDSRLQAAEKSSKGLSSSNAEPKPPLKVSLIIPVRDEAETIHQLIDSIQQQSRPPDETIFVDGGSRDGTVDALRQVCKQTPGFRVIETRKALPGQGRNIGAASASYDWIAFTDAGNRLEPDWLEQLLAVANSDPDAGIVCGDFEPVTDSFFTECAAIAYLSTRRHAKTVWSADHSSHRLWCAERRLATWAAFRIGALPRTNFFRRNREEGPQVKWAPKATVHWEMRPGLWTTFRRFLLYSCVNVWAQRQNQWHYGVARPVRVGPSFFHTRGVEERGWLLVPLRVLSVRSEDALDFVGKAGLSWF